MERKMSNKINYDVLRSLTSSADPAPESILPHNEDTPVVVPVEPVVPVRFIESGAIIPPPRKRNITESDTEDSMPLATTSAKKAKKIKTESKANIIKIKEVPEELETVVEEATTSTDVLVESGPPPEELDDYDEESMDGFEKLISLIIYSGRMPS